MISLDIGRVVPDSFGDTKVDEFKFSSNKNEVGGFEISMDDLFFMDGMNGFEHLEDIEVA